jgi:hypothetical protein
VTLGVGNMMTLDTVDGSTTSDILAQIAAIPKDATHLVLSVGGNDALASSHILTRGPASAVEVLEYLAVVVEEFDLKYRAAVKASVALHKPLLLCTIYNGNLPREVAAAARAAVSVFNDRIYQIAGLYSLPVLELRRVCTEASDYANPIEPSSVGGKKIAASIVASLRRLGQ